MSNLYFETKHHILTDYDIHKIAEAMTGNELCDTDKDVREFARSCPGIIKEITEPTVEYFVSKNETVKAIKLYRDIHGCSIVEAKDTVNKIAGENI